MQHCGSGNVARVHVALLLKQIPCVFGTWSISKAHVEAQYWAHRSLYRASCAVERRVMDEVSLDDLLGQLASAQQERPKVGP